MHLVLDGMVVKARLNKKATTVLVLVAMLFWALLASGQIRMRKVDGWAHLAQPIQPIQPILNLEPL